jgi:hypothetical protein
LVISRITIMDFRPTAIRTPFQLMATKGSRTGCSAGAFRVTWWTTFRALASSG